MANCDTESETPYFERPLLVVGQKSEITAVAFIIVGWSMK